MKISVRGDKIKVTEAMNNYVVEKLKKIDKYLDNPEEVKANVVVRVEKQGQKVEVKPMNEEEAILQMELLGHQFYMYKDSDTNKPAVVYKRNDGNYGVIESE